MSAGRDLRDEVAERACGSCSEPAPYTIVRQGKPTPVCLRHLNHWREPVQHGYGDTSDCLCGRNFDTVRGLREHLTKTRLRERGQS